MKKEKILAISLVGIIVIGFVVIQSSIQNEGKPLVKLPTLKGVVVVVEK
jgi:hypothetical protein